jgi:hypothetical protein
MGGTLARRVCGIVFALLVCIGMFGSLPARADILTDIENVIDASGLLAPLYFGQLQSVLSQCDSDSSAPDDVQVANCVQAIADSPSSSGSSPDGISKLVKIYIDIRTENWGQLFVDGSEEIVCLAAKVVTGVDICGVLQDFADLASAVADVVSGVIQDVGAGWGDLLGLDNPQSAAGPNGGAPTSAYAPGGGPACPVNVTLTNTNVSTTIIQGGSNTNSQVNSNPLAAACTCPGGSQIQGKTQTQQTVNNANATSYVTQTSFSCGCPFGQAWINGSCSVPQSGGGVGCPYGQVPAPGGQSCVSACPSSAQPPTTMFTVCGQMVCLTQGGWFNLEARINPTCSTGPAICHVNPNFPKPPFAWGDLVISDFSASCPVSSTRPSLRAVPNARLLPPALNQQPPSAAPNQQPLHVTPNQEPIRANPNQPGLHVTLSPQASPNSQVCPSGTQLYPACGVEICLTPSENTVLQTRLNPSCGRGRPICHAPSLPSPILGGARALNLFSASCGR